MPIHFAFKNRRISFLAPVLLCALSGHVNADTSESEATCGTGDFKTFFYRFATDSVLQQASIATPLTLQTLENGSALKIKLEKLNEKQRPIVLLPPPDQWAQLGLIFEWLPPATVVLRGQQGEYLRTYVFKRRSCWMLSREEDWALGGSKLSTDSSLKMDAESCLRRAKAYELSTSFAQHTPARALFAASLDSYLCAAGAGSLEASYTAASLSLSGQAPRLKNDRIEMLFTAAAEQLPEAALTLANFYCDQGDYTQQQPCLRPKKAEQAMIKSARLGSTDALNQLGRAFEIGSLGTQDTQRALACYQAAASKGLQLAEKNAKRLSEQGVRNEQNISCLSAGR